MWGYLELCSVICFLNVNEINPNNQGTPNEGAPKFWSIFFCSIPVGQKHPSQGGFLLFVLFFSRGKHYKSQSGDKKLQYEISERKDSF